MPTIEEDWTRGSRALLDLATVLVASLLVVFALYMSVQDYARHFQSTSAFQLSGETRALDVAYRLQYVPYLLAVSAFLTFASLWRWLRIRQSRRLRRHGARFVALLAVGSGIVDGAYYADTAFGLTAPHAVRAVLIDPLYALGGVLAAGAAWRLRTLIRPLPPGDPEEG